MSFKKILIGALVVLVIGFGYYAISPLFRHVQVDEPLPMSTTEKINEMPEAASQPIITTAEVKGTIGHPASGKVRVVEADGKAYVRYEDLKTINGPDIYVYLAKDLDAKEYISLGKVRATEGNVNYEIPTGTVVADYPYVLTWCKQFGILFNSAKVQ
jgi:hypothetical protein